MDKSTKEDTSGSNHADAALRHSHVGGIHSGGSGRFRAPPDIRRDHHALLMTPNTGQQSWMGIVNAIDMQLNEISHQEGYSVEERDEEKFVQLPNRHDQSS